MAEDPEKKFHSIMEKLFTSPANLSTKQKKRIHTGTSMAGSDPKIGNISGSLSSSSASTPSSPLCRPWDRRDLLKRLNTFKSMTWFAKPKVVSAVNCARRGWVNVDMDTLACEACGAHMLFTTPSSWPWQQVEKAALVFSLKLENGHKFLCPWINNSSDERLIEFPPTPHETLVDDYEQRFSSLTNLSSLPKVSLLSFTRAKNPHFENFVTQSSPSLYHQAQKLISLTGWEPRTLPYIVDPQPKSSNLVHRSDIINPSKENSEGATLDSNSIVLECKFCGATVGLWAFAKTHRPLEVVRLVGSIESVEPTDKTGKEEASSSSTFSIAGGPPPAKQNFKAVVSFPVIGKNIRARLRIGALNEEHNGETVLSNSGVSSGEEALALDPIQQHKHFCPWIASSTNAAAGWAQTLDALARRGESPESCVSRTLSSSSVIKVDDPIASVRNLFKSPVTKRMKLTGSPN